MESGGLPRDGGRRPPTFGLGMSLSNFGLPTAFCLPLGSLPAAHELQALRGLAVALIPTPGLIDLTATSTQADPRAQPTAGGV